MRQNELPQLECTVSLLTCFELASNLDDWEIGLHGVWIDFTDPSGRARSAVYLPDVIPEQGGSIRRRRGQNICICFGPRAPIRPSPPL